MRIIRKTTQSVAGKSVAPQNPSLTKGAESVSRSDRLRVGGKQAFSLAQFKEATPVSTEAVLGSTRLPPPVILQPVDDLLFRDTDNFLEEVVDAFDSAFEAACPSNVGINTQIKETKQDEQAEAALRDLFVQIAANYAIPLKNFIFELRRGTATKEEIEFCRPILYSIRNAAETINLTRTVQHLSEVDKVLALGQNGSHWLLQGELRQQILSSYEALAEVLPGAFQLGEEGRRREDTIIRSLLEQIPGLGCATLEKLYKAGLGSLDALFLANKEDLADATGISLRMCELICEKVAQHRKKIETMPRDAVKSAWLNRLAEMVDRLRHEIEVERPQACLQETVASNEQHRRQQRQLLFLEITVILAELGELNLLNRMHRLSFRQRLQTLDGHLAMANRLYLAL